MFKKCTYDVNESAIYECFACHDGLCAICGYVDDITDRRFCNECWKIVQESRLQNQEATVTKAAIRTVIRELKKQYAPPLNITDWGSDQDYYIGHAASVLLPEIEEALLGPPSAVEENQMNDDYSRGVEPLF